MNKICRNLGMFFITMTRCLSLTYTAHGDEIAGGWAVGGNRGGGAAVGYASAKPDLRWNLSAGVLGTPQGIRPVGSIGAFWCSNGGFCLSAPEVVHSDGSYLSGGIPPFLVGMGFANQDAALLVTGGLDYIYDFNRKVGGAGGGIWIHGDRRLGEKVKAGIFAKVSRIDVNSGAVYYRINPWIQYKLTDRAALIGGVEVSDLYVSKDKDGKPDTNDTGSKPNAQASFGVVATF